MDHVLKNISFIVVICWLSCLFAQAPDTLWTKTFGGLYYDSGTDIQQTNDSGYIILGITYSYGQGIPTYNNAYLIKTDENGDTLWTKVYGGPDHDACVSIQQTSDSGFIAAGATGPVYSVMDVYVIKTDENGDTLWTRTYGGPYQDGGKCIQQTSDDGYIVIGSTLLDAINGFNYFLVKTNAFGDTIWTRTYGRADFDLAYHGQQTNDDGYVMVGLTEGLGTDTSNVYMIKTDSIGDTLWTKIFGRPFTDEGYCIQQTSDDGYIISGLTKSSGGSNYDVYVVKTDSRGDTLWTKTYGGPGDDVGSSVVQTIDGGYIIAGHTSSFGAGNFDGYLIRLNSDGDSLWTQTFGGPSYDMFSSVRQTTDNGYIAVGLTRSFGSAEGDIYVVKIAPDTFGIRENKLREFKKSSLKVIPNPFKHSTSIKCTFSGSASIKIYDCQGQQVKEISSGRKNDVAFHTIVWDGTNDRGERLPDGVYFVLLEARNKIIAEKIVKLE